MPSRRRRVREELQGALAGVPDLAGTLRAADGVLRRALGAEGSAWGTVDPTTTLSTGCARHGVLDTGPDDAAAAARERRLFQLDWADGDPHTPWDMARRGLTAAALRAAAPAPEGVRRYAELLQPAGVHDELRVRLAVDGEQWATVVLHRFEPRASTPDDVAVAGAAAPVLARAVRTALLRAVCDSPAVPAPPGSLLLDGDDRVLVSSAAAEDLLAALPGHRVPTVLAALGAATRARGTASLTVPAASGVLAELLLQRAARGQLARRLRMTEHTVGDHLQSVYRKAGVAGRAELAAVLFGRHYAPLRDAGVPPSPYGYFVGAG